MDGTLDWEDMAPRALAQIRERNAWMETAEQAQRDRDFYHSIVTQIGEMFGDEAKTADDGTVGGDVLALKVPECVRKLLQDRRDVYAEAARVIQDTDLDRLRRQVMSAQEAANAASEMQRLRADIEAARQEAFRYGFKRDCDDSDPDEVAEADELISLVSWIAQAECQARAERDSALCRLREFETRFVPYGGRGGCDRLLTAAVPPEMFDGVAVIDRTEAGQGAVVGTVKNPRRDANGNMLADVVYDQDGKTRLVGTVHLRRMG